MWVLLGLIYSAVAVVSQSFYVCTLKNVDYYSDKIPSAIQITSPWTMISSYGYSPSCEPYQFRTSSSNEVWVGYKAICKSTHGLYPMIDTSSVPDMSYFTIPTFLYEKTGIYYNQVSHAYITSVEVCIHKGFLSSRSSRNLSYKLDYHNVQIDRDSIHRRNYKHIDNRNNKNYRHRKIIPKLPNRYRFANRGIKRKRDFFTKQNKLDNFIDYNHPIHVQHSSENKPIQITIYNQHSFQEKSKETINKLKKLKPSITPKLTIAPTITPKIPNKTFNPTLNLPKPTITPTRLLQVTSKPSPIIKSKSQSKPKLQYILKQVKSFARKPYQSQVQSKNKQRLHHIQVKPFEHKQVQSKNKIQMIPKVKTKVLKRNHRFLKGEQKKKFHKKFKSIQSEIKKMRTKEDHKRVMNKIQNLRINIKR
jgi:hypothetical protein